MTSPGEITGQSHLLDIKNNQLEHIMEWVVNKLRGILRGDEYGPIQAEHFGRLTDPRLEKRIEHGLLDISVIAICGVIWGADSWVEIEGFGKAKQDGLKGFLELPNGIPSHDRLGGVFACLSAFHFQACFMSWIEASFGLWRVKWWRLRGRGCTAPMSAVQTRGPFIG
jgi:DDE_Tnp_1-associated